MDEGNEEKFNLEWYAVKLIYEFIITGEPDLEKIDEHYNTHKHFEESIMLVKASSFEHAYTIAEMKAKESEDNYLSAYGENVNKVFAEAIGCFHLFDEELETGTELYSRILHAPKDLSREEFLDKYYPETINEKRTIVFFTTIYISNNQLSYSVIPLKGAIMERKLDIKRLYCCFLSSVKCFLSKFKQLYFNPVLILGQG